MRIGAGFVPVLLVALGCGDDGGGQPDAAPVPDAAGPAPTLIQRAPAQGATNVWQQAPVVLTYDLPLDPATVTGDALYLEVGGEQLLPSSVELSSDGTTITARFPALQTPVSPTITVTSSITGVNGTPVAELGWGFAVPDWHRGELGDGGPPVEPAVATGGAVPYLALADPSAALYVYAGSDDGWSALGGAIAMPVSKVALAARGDGSPVVAYGDGAGPIAVRQWDGAAWTELAVAVPGSAATGFDLAIGTDDRPVVAWIGSGGDVEVRRWSGTAWDVVGGGAITTGGTFGDVAVAVRGDRPVIAYLRADDQLIVRQQPGATDPFDTVTPIARRGTGAGATIDLSADATHAYVAWTDDADGRTHARAAAIDAVGIVTPLGGSFGIDPAGTISGPALLASAGSLLAAWTEGATVRVARWTGEVGDGRWQILGGDATQLGDANVATRPALARTSDGNPVVAWNDGAFRIRAARYNSSPTPPHGIAERFAINNCVIPTGTPPATLAATGCFSGRQPAPELVPYDIRSPLWSDGARKRRWMVVPDGQALGYAAAGAWTVPVGTILIKQFSILADDADPTSLIPVETRLLIKRCEPGSCATPLEGLSYQWDDAGSRADLLDGSAAATKAWTVTRGGVSATHTHVYPGADDCRRCHNQAAGVGLGLQTGQLNRAVDYGEVADDQIRLLEHLGLVTGLPTSPDHSELPRPADPAYSDGDRTRAYLHANCAQCHRPGSEMPTLDLRFDAPLTADNICDKLTPGDSAGSTLYQRDASRAGDQMPPLATLIPDDDQLIITARWIDTMSTCP